MISTTKKLKVCIEDTEAEIAQNLQLLKKIKFIVDFKLIKRKDIYKK